MSQYQKKSKLLVYGSYAVIIILVISFIGATILTSGLSNQSSTLPEFGKYGSKAIKYSEYNTFGRFVNSNIYNLEQQYPQAKGNQVLLQQAWKQGFDQTVLMYALLDMGQKVGFKLSDERIKELITTSPEFSNEDGTFNQTLFNNIDKNIKDSIIDFTVDLEIAQKIQQDIADLAYISTKEFEFFNNLNRDQKSFYFIRFDRYTLKEDKILVEYGEAHKELFKKIHYRSITLDSKAEAESVYNKIISNETSFEDSVSFSIDSAKENAGDRGSSYTYQIKNSEGEDVLNALLKLQSTSSISDVVETETGNFAIYKLSQEIEDVDLTNQETLTAIQEYLVTYDSGIIDDEVNKYAENFIENAKAQGFEQAARISNVELAIIPLAPLNVDNIDVLDKIESEGTDINTLVSSDDVLSEMYALDLQEISKPFPLGAYLYVFQVRDITHEAPATQAIEERVHEFIDAENQKNLKDGVVDENKLTDNFNKVFGSLN